MTSDSSGATSWDLRITRSVEWLDTDASGHYHHSTVLRWVEAAEAELHERLGVPDLFGVMPRVRIEVNFRARLWFRDRVDICLRVARMGAASITYEFAALRGGEVAADGLLVAAHIDPVAGKAAPWPEHVRNAFAATMSTH